MANTKISEFGSATALAGTELIPVIQGADNKNTTPLDLKKYVFKSQANIWGYVTAHADLPLTTTDTDPEAGDLVGVNNTTGTWILGTQRKLGFYKRLATTGTVDQQYGTSPYASYVPNADIIGDEAYTEKNYITEENTIRENIDALDVAVKDARPMTSAGDIIYGGTSGVPTRLAIGTAYQKLRVKSDATAPEYSADHEVIGIALSDTTTALTVGEKAKFDMPFAFTITRVYASVATAPVGSALQVDIEDEGTTILNAVLEIAASANNGETSTFASSATSYAFSKGDLISFDIDQVGSTTAGAGLVVFLEGYRT